MIGNRTVVIILAGIWVMAMFATARWQWHREKQIAEAGYGDCLLINSPGLRDSCVNEMISKQIHRK